jgi:hypothetical protein
MRNNKVIGFALAGLVTLGGAGCSVDKFLDVNNTPNNPITAPPSVLLTSTAISTAFSNGNEINRITSLLVQHVAGAPGTLQAQPQDRYNIRGGLDNQWQFEQYAGILKNAQTLIETAGSVNSPAYAGIAKLLKAYNYAMVTDLWGDIPYSEALQGLNKLQPRFDKQEDIYKGNAGLGIQSLDALIKEGLADLDATSTLKPSASDDPVYAGDLAKWKRMGNTLRLKLANTISRKEPALARTIINEVIAANNFISSNADDFEVRFGGAVGNRNPIADYNGINIVNPTTGVVTAAVGIGQRPVDQLLSQRLLDSMAVRNDPRLPIFFNTVPATAGTPAAPVAGVTTTTVGTFRGAQNGSNVPLPNAGTARSKYFTYLTGNSGEAPIRLITNFQRLFIMAESALILGTSTGGAANVQALYRDAIRASMTKAGLTNAQVDAYFTDNPKVANLSTNQTLAHNQIMTQKWIAWVGNGYEAYNDYRRTGFPRLALAQNAEGDNPNILPKRFVYPASELSGNANNAPAAGTEPNTTVPVWWDVD